MAAFASDPSAFRCVYCGHHFQTVGTNEHGQSLRDHDCTTIRFKLRSGDATGADPHKPWREQKDKR